MAAVPARGLVTFAAAATGLVMATGTALLPLCVMLALAVYLVASRMPRRWYGWGNHHIL